MQNINYIIGVIVVLFVGVLGYVFFGASSNADLSKANLNEKYSQEQNSTSTQITELQNTDQNVNVTTQTKKEETKKFMNKVTMTTNYGTITLELNPKIAPNTVANFIKLANSGFYDGVKFHRVISGFMIQTGDPLSKDDSKQKAWGTGGPDYRFADELEGSKTLGYSRGTLAMANSGPNTNGSQFFIMHKDYPLPPLYSVFGKVTSGIEVVDKIAGVETLYPGQLDRPVTPIVISKVVVE
jgi:cyclophilin family peptidyl-prolyl cis-trans isomerase